jgi:putative transposase
LPHVPLRQFVLTIPHELCRRVAYDGKLFGALSRLFADSVLAWYHRRLADEGAPRGRGGAVVVMQRSSSDLRLNPHLHGVFLDGVYVMESEGVPSFRALPDLSTSDVADVLQVTRVRIVRFRQRRGVLSADAEPTEVDDGFAEREPVLAELAAAAVSGLPLAGPEVRRRPIEIPLRGRPGVAVTKPRCVEEMGFTLHADTRAGALDERGRDALLEYVLRPPIASENVQQAPEGLVRIVLKRPFRDGTTAVDLDPLSLLCRLAAMVPPPRLHTVRYQGVLSSASKWRSLVIPPPPAPDGAASEAPVEEPRPAGGKRSRYWR